MNKHECYILFLCILLLMNSACSFCKQTNIIPKDNSVILAEAIEIGRQKLLSINRRVWDTELNIIADNNNSLWKRYTDMQPLLLEDGLIKNMYINNQEYWAIYYEHDYEENSGKNSLYVRHTENAWVFIEKYSGKVLGVMLFK